MTTSMKKLIITAVIATAMTMTVSAEGNVVYQPLHTEVPTKPTHPPEEFLKTKGGLSDFGLRIVKPDGSKLTEEEIIKVMTPNVEVCEETMSVSSKAETATAEKKSSITITVGDESKAYYKQDCEPDPNAKAGDTRIHDGVECMRCTA